MKGLILILLLFSIPFIAFTQKYELIHNEMAKPPIAADTASIKQINQGYVGFSKKDMDSIIIVLKSLKNYFIPDATKKNKYIQIKLTHTFFVGEKIQMAFGYRYDINMYSFSGDLSGKIIIANSRLSNKQNLKRIDDLIAYCTSAK